ncbi:DNA-binding protein [Streptomyces pathocidini]|uniref:DNA-binding protein n=1 Tax=Streptomyces pathocidini TaxID=1650571 RepID=UPI0033E42567
MDERPRTLLKALVAQRHWRYSDFLTHFNRTAEKVIKKGTANPTISEAQFRRWTSGAIRTLPSPDACRVLEEMFGVSAAALFQEPPSPESPAPAFSLKDEIDMTARDASSEAGSAASASISDTTLDQLRDDVASLARRYNTFSAFEVLQTARKLREEAEHHRDRTQVPIQQQDLLIIAGQTCALLSAAAFDLGSLSGATRLARAAALYGETARFTPLRAFAGGALAYIAYFSGRPAEAAQIAQRARMLTGLGDVAHRRLAAIEARAHGHRGDATSAQQALDVSRRESRGECDDLHDGVAGEFGFPGERLAMSNASTCLLLGDGVQAEVEARTALELVNNKPEALRSARVAGGAAADLAAARLLKSDLDGAADALEGVWVVPGEQRATGLLTRAARVRRALTDQRFRRTPLAAEIGERLEHFSRLAAQNQLGAGTGAVAALEV